MIKAKNNHFFKRLMAFILVLITLSSALSVTAFAGDSVFMETLLNTDKYTYVANLTSDTKNKSKKYAYKYMNLAYVVGKGCTTDGSLNTDETQKNPNYCFRLEERYEYTKIDYRSNKSTEGADAMNANNNSGGYGKALDLFLLLEGYVEKNTVNVMITDDSNVALAASVTHKYITQTKVKNTTSPLSYPGYYTETVTTEQSEYAQEAVNLLTSSLNGILAEVNDGNKFKSVTELVNKSILIRPDTTANIATIYKHAEGYRGYVIVYSDLTDVKPGLEYETSTGQANRILSGYRLNNGEYSIPTDSSDFLNALNLPRANAEKQLYAYVFPMNDDGTKILVNDASVFIYAIPKGFTKITGKYTTGAAFTMTTPEFTEKGKTYDYTTAQEDVPWVNIHMLSMYANTVYKHHNISVTTYVEPDTNLFSKLIAGIFSAILSVIRSVLGLADIDVLVFNLGVRGSAAYNFGLMSENWWNVVLQYQLIFQAIAWVILVCGFIKTLIDLNLSTINPQKRMSVYETIQKFIVVGIGLVILIPAVQFLLECNNVLVELFASQIETSALNMPSVNNALVQFLVGMMWITILLYINFIYIMRSITIALLIASGPFFISTIAFSHGGKSALFSSWSKELLANIFVQSVHAFILSFLMQLLSSGTFLETFAIAISIIPLTEMFRNLIFAGAGGSTSQMANTAAGAMNRMGTAVGKGVVSAGGAAIGGIFGKGEGGGDGEKGGGGGGKGGDGKGSTTGSLISNAAQKKLGKMGDGTSHGSKIAQSMANKAGKDKPNFGMKALGGAVDSLEVAGMVMGAGMAEIAASLPELQQGMADLALKGDYQGLGKAMDKVTTAQGKQVGGAVAGGVNAARQKNDVQKASSAVQTDNTAQMGQSAMTAESVAKGQTAGGATMQTPKLTGEKEVYSRNAATQTTDLSSASPEAQAQAYAHYEAGSNKSVKDALAFNADGSTTKGKEYSYTYTDDKGREKQGSFFVAGNGVSQDVWEKAQTAEKQLPQSVAGGQARAVARKESIAAASSKKGREGEQATAAMASLNSTGDVTGRYFDADGKAIEGGKILTDDSGNMTYVDNSVISNPGNALQSYAASQLATNNGITFNQTMEGYSGKVAGKYGANESGVVDMTTAQLGAESDAAYTDAAMIASIGDSKGMPDGVYKIGDYTFNTGLSKQQATQILASRGINGVHSDAANMSYHQHTPRATNNSFVATRQGSNGHPIAQYATGIGKQGGPTWQADGSGGGTMKFTDQRSAVTYFQAQGNTSMANEIANMSANTSYTRGAQTFSNTSEGFSLSFKGSELKKQGMQMEIASNGSDMYVSSFDAQVKDPFALDNSPVTPTDDSRKPEGTLTAETVGDHVPSGTTTTTA